MVLVKLINPEDRVKFPRGAHGGVVGKEYDDKLILAARQSKYTMSMEPEEVDKRDKHRVNGKFCRLINSNHYLHQVWEKSDLKPVKIYNRICKVNFDLCKTVRPSETNVITPPGGFPLRVEKLVYTQEKVHAEIQAINLNENEGKIIYLLYTALYEPIDPQSCYFSFIQVMEGVSDQPDIVFNLNPEDQNLAAGYNFMVLYFCAVTIDSNGEIIRHSETVAVDSGLPVEISETELAELG